jgi:lysozyme
MSDEPQQVLGEIPGLVDWLLAEAARRDALIASLMARGYGVSAPKAKIVEAAEAVAQPREKAAPAVEPDEVEAVAGSSASLIAAMKRLGHSLFESDAKPYNLNIVAVRDTSPTLDAYGCRLYVLWREAGKWMSRDWAITTYPGSHYLIRRLLSRKGCAILKEGQYRGAYAIDLHRELYRALCQRLGSVTVYRDGNRNRTFDLDPAKTETGMFGINVHAPVTLGAGVRNYVDNLVDSSSAGCLVFRAVREFEEFMGLVTEAAKHWGNAFTLTLIKDTDLVARPVETKPFTVGPDGIALVKHFEGCLEPVGNGTFKAYADPAHGWNVPTIGWGTIAYEDGRKVRRGDVITQDRADELLAWELSQKAAEVKRLVTVPLNQGQFDALVSFAYNLGGGNLRESTLLRKLNAGDVVGAAEEFPKWNKAAGRELLGLTRRRMSEQRLFRGERPFIVTLDEVKRLD